MSPRIKIYVLVLLFANSCAPVKLTLQEYGFFSGIFHGFIALPAFIGKYLIGMNIGIYADYNSGFAYDIGFGLGFVLFIVTIILIIISLRDNW